MKIIYLHQYFNTPTMAGGTRSYEMARRLTAAGHEVHMVTSWRKDDNRRGWYRTEDAGIQVHWLPVPYSNRMKYPARIKAFGRFAFAAARKAASLGGDIIFATSTPLTIALSAVYAARRNRIPMVFEVRDLWPEVPIAVGALKSPVLKMAARWLERFAYHNSRHIVVLSPGMKEGVIKTGYPAERVTVIPNGCDIDFFNTGPEPGKLLRQQYPWLQDRPLIIYAGTIGTVNGVDYLARIAAAVGDLDKEVRILIIGEGIGEEKLHQEAKKLGVFGNNLFVMPKIPKELMPGWLAAADMAFSVFIDTKAMWANSANKFFDILAAGKPVAINYGGWQADLIQKTGAGLVLHPVDAISSARQIVQALNNKEWLARAGTAARALAVERFHRDKLAKELEAVLLQAVAAHSS